MKPNVRQDELLKNYLRQVFLYRETYEEVYDHMISALQEQSNTRSFQDAVNEIIRRDFGGHDNLRAMEKNCKTAMVKDLRYKQFGYFMSFFKFPLLLYILGLAVGVYSILTKGIIADSTMRWVFWGMALVPYFAIPLRLFYTGYIFGETKRSIRDNMMSDLSMLPMRVFCAAGALYVFNGLYAAAYNPSPVITTMAVVVYVVYFSAYLKLSKDEFKVRMIK